MNSRKIPEARLWPKKRWNDLYDIFSFDDVCSTFIPTFSKYKNSLNILFHFVLISLSMSPTVANRSIRLSQSLSLNELANNTRAKSGKKTNKCHIACIVFTYQNILIRFTHFERNENETKQNKKMFLLSFFSFCILSVIRFFGIVFR